MDWDWQNILFLVATVAVAAFMLYRAVVKKKWCPDIYGSGACVRKEAGHRADDGRKSLQ